MASKHISAARLLGLGLTPGKLRGLQRIGNPNGTLSMVATDQNSSMYTMIKEALKKKGDSRDPTFEEMVEAKITLTRALAPHCSGLLTDAYYGYFNVVAADAAPAGTGLLVRVEKSGGEKNKAGAPIADYEPGLSVAKIKAMGVDAVKLLASYEPTEPDSAERNLAYTQEIYEECKKHDILFLLETVAFPFGGEDKKSAAFLDRKAETVIESARFTSAYCDIYKAEFPGWLDKHSDADLHGFLKELDKACVKPWVLLSAGVDYPQYKRQVEMAVECGASGVLGGRAFWKEYFLNDTQEQREAFAAGESAKRVKEIHEIVMKRAKPWYARYGMTADDLKSVRVAEGWHFRYGKGGAGGTSKVVAGETY